MEAASGTFPRLDGRQMLAGGPMGLRTALLPEPSDRPRDSQAEMVQETGAPTAGSPIQVGPASQLLDQRVCECCQTDAATTGEGPIVVSMSAIAAAVMNAVGGNLVPEIPMTPWRVQRMINVMRRNAETGEKGAGKEWTEGLTGI